MRKIEEEMLNAIECSNNFSKANTAVVYKPREYKAYVYLHGNCLGYYSYMELLFITDQQTLIDYPTRTTTSRLRALGADVSIKAGIPYLNGVAVT